MTSIVTNKEIKKIGLTKISNSNKNIFLKKDENRKKDDLIYHSDLHEKTLIKKTALISNTSVKKMKQIKKISINDNESKFKIAKIKKKLDSSNKENHENNDKEKNNLKKSAKKKMLKNIVNAAKIQIKQNFPKKMNENKNINLENKEIIKNKNKLSSFLNISEDISKMDKKKKEEKISKISKKIKKYKKEEKDKEKKEIIPLEISTVIQNEINEKENKNEIEDNKEIEYTFKYNRKNMSEQKIRSQGGGNIGNIIPLMKMKKEHIKYSIKKKRQKPNISIKNKKLIYEEDLNNSYFIKYNSINHEKGTNRSYIDIINNFDIINIINKKEETKKLSSSIQKNSFNNTQELSKKKKGKIQKNVTSSNINNTNNSIDNKIINILSKSNQNNKKSTINKIKENSYGLMRKRNKDPPNNIAILNTEKKLANNDNYNYINNNTIQNKWDNKYFIPVVSASLINNEDKDNNKEMENFKKRKINADKPSLNNYGNINKKSTNFGDNNKKKREMLFNFSNKKLKNENYSYINFHSKRTGSFISKRNKHITERNNSIHNMKSNNYNSYLENDLEHQEKELELIRNEISQEKIKEKLNRSNKCAISVDNISDNSFDKNKMEQIILVKGNKLNKKHFKTFHIKVNSINKLNNSSENKSTVIIKRGDLLNRLRNIKHNYSIMENKN